MGRRGLRRAYNPVSSTAEEDDTAAIVANEEERELNSEGEVFVDEDVEAPRRGRRGGRRQYQTVNTEAQDDDDDDNDKDTVDSEDDDTTNHDDDDSEEDGTRVTIVILDPAQKKFSIPAFTHWSIAKFKEKGEKVHKVAPASQRLIYRGQLLQDSSTLEGVGLDSDKLIVHLFPKPRVVIQQSTTCTAAGEEDSGDEEAQNTGAHIPQIVLNPDEAEQRAHILVLGSADFLEAQNNVKLFSFLLLVISSIELFNLLLILMGVPPDNTAGNDAYNTEDDFFHIDTNTTDAATNNPYNNNPYGTNDVEVDPYQEAAIQRDLQTWHPRNNIDLIISAVGVYVALLGIRATNETTLRLAQQYLVGTVIVGIAWMMFNYWFTVHVDEEFDQLRRDERHNRTAGNGTDPVVYDDDAIPYKTELEYYQQNLSLMMIPGMVWVLCCVRAWQFQSLLEEAEREAEERIRNELAQHTVNGNSSSSTGEDDTGEGEPDEEGGRTTSAPTALELQNSSSVIS